MEKPLCCVAGFDGGGVLVKVSIGIFGMGGQVMVIFSILVMVWGVVKGIWILCCSRGRVLVSCTWCK